MKRTRIVATALGRRVGASTERGGYKFALTIVLLVATHGASAQTPMPLPSTSPTDPASEPVVLAVAKVMPAVVNINAERVVRRQVRDPFLRDLPQPATRNPTAPAKSRLGLHC